MLEEIRQVHSHLLDSIGEPNTMVRGMAENAEWFILFLICFPLLAFLIPSKKDQPLLRRDMLTDAFYWFFAPFLYSPVFKILIGILATSQLMISINRWGVDYFSHFSVFTQAFLILLISDFFQYWLHRFFHRNPLWDYHAIHHSAQNVDWLTSARFHPVNIILYSTMVNAFVALMGFSMDAFLLLQPFNMVYSPLVHANVPWTYGPFKYVLASPVFHRWHHTHLNEGGNKNFAPTFSFLDVIFGTYYMPKDRQPEIFGIEGDPVPQDVIGQLVYPFKSKGKE